MSLRRGKGQSKDGTLDVRLPPGSAQSREGGHDIHAAIVGNTGCQGFHLHGMSYQLQLVGNPLQRSTRAVDISLEAVVHLTEGRKAHAGHQTLRCSLRLLADIDHHARTSAVGHLTATLLETHLSHQGSM